MPAQCHKDGGLLSDGYLNGLGVSLLAHLLVFLLVAVAPWVFPKSQPTLPMCTVSLLGMDGGGSPEGEEGAMSKGDGEPAPAASAESMAPESVENVAAAEPEPEAPEVMEDAVPLEPVPKTVEEPKEKPRPKIKPKPKPKPTRAQKVAKVETPPPAVPKAPSVGTSTSDGTVGGHGEGAGLGEGDGRGKGSSGDGRGAGSGVGDGAGGGGPFGMAFGSGDGPRFANKVMPRYPRFARQIGKEGTVLLSVTIDEHGKLARVEVLKAAGSGFDEEAVRAVKKSSFYPARRHGKPIVCRAHLSIRFVLTDSHSN